MYIYLGDFYREGKISKKYYENLVNRNILHSKLGKGKILNVSGESSKYIEIEFRNKRIYKISSILEDIAIEVDADIINEFKTAVKELEELDIYVNKLKHNEWKKKYQYLYNTIKYIIRQWDESILYIDKFKEIYLDDDVVIINKEYLKKEKIKYKEIFDNVNKISLDENQRDVVVKDEDRHLVVAGAGCGKTTLICAKVMYLLKKYNINSDEIAVISFSNKAVDDMNEKIQYIDILKDIDVMTIHKLGKNIISEVENKYINVCDSIDKLNIIKRCFEDLLKDDIEFKSLIVNYYTNYYYPKEDESFKSKYEYMKYLKNSGTLITIQGERVRSFEELEIANFLFTNGIRYKYEVNYEFQEGYNPDFYLYEYNIYIEHFGEDRNGNAPMFFTDRDEYIYRNREKVDKHRRYGTNLIISKSYYKYQGGITQNLKQELIKKGIRLKPISNDIVLRFINQSIKYEGLQKLIIKFIDYIKNEVILEDDVFNYKTKSRKDNHTLERERIFFKILNKVYKKYQQQLYIDKKIDFSDMINISKEYVKSGKGIKKYKYIIVDEMQDISKNISEFIKCLLEINKGCKLFCVGDDWQSIYGFNGSDLDLFYGFKDIYESSYISYITNTYRFDKNIVDISNKFILLDNSHMKKELVSKKSKSVEQCVPKYNFIDILEEISKIEGNKDTTVYLLGRYKDDIKKLDRYKDIIVKGNKSDVTYSKNTKLNIKFMTVHGSKGLEADYVIILNCEKGTEKNYMRGFPSEIRDDPLLNIRFYNHDENNKMDIFSRLYAVSKYNNLRESEERRLFYVAMTRAKKQVYFIMPNSYSRRSKYINDINNIKSINS